MRLHRTILAAGAMITTLLTAAPAAAAPAAAAPAAPGGRILYLQVAQSRGSGELRSVRPDGSQAVGYGRQFASYSSPDYSPDGKRIAYAEDFSIRVLSAVDGSGDSRLVDGPCGPSSPRWSPDGRWIAFESCSDIYKVSIDGPSGGFDNVTENDLNDLQPSWGPRGTRIASATLPGVQVYQADGSSSRTLSNLPDASRLDWNPNGRTIAVEADGDLWLVDAVTGAARRLTNTPTIVESGPVWSPDGRWLAYGRGAVDPDDPFGNASIAPQIWLMTETGTQPHSTGVAGVPTSWRATA